MQVTIVENYYLSMFDKLLMVYNFAFYMQLHSMVELLEYKMCSIDRKDQLNLETLVKISPVLVDHKKEMEEVVND